MARTTRPGLPLRSLWWHGLSSPCARHLSFMAAAIGLALSLPAAAASSKPDLAKGLVLHWPLDKDASDTSGHGLDGTIHGATPVAKGRVGGAFNFDGADDYISIPPKATSGLLWATFAMWVNTTQSLANSLFWRNPALMGVATGGYGSRDMALMLKEGRPAFFHGLFQEGADVAWFSRVSIADGKWHHIALVNRGPRTCLYVDGRKVPGEAFLFGSSGGRYLGPMRDAVAGREIGATRLFLGATNFPGKSGETPVAFYRGLIDDFRIWRRPLTPADIAALMATAARR